MVDQSKKQRVLSQISASGNSEDMELFENNIVMR